MSLILQKSYFSLPKETPFPKKHFSDASRFNNPHILTWNANGLAARMNELEVFLNYINHIDVAMISETYFTTKNYVKIRGYSAYWTTHPSGRVLEEGQLLSLIRVFYTTRWKK